MASFEEQQFRLESAHAVARSLVLYRNLIKFAKPDALTLLTIDQ